MNKSYKTVQSERRIETKPIFEEDFDKNDSEVLIGDNIDKNLTELKIEKEKLPELFQFGGN